MHENVREIPETYLRYARELIYICLLNICLQYGWNMLEILLGWYGWQVPKIFLGYAWDMADMCLRYSYDVPKLWLRYARGMPNVPMMWLRSEIMSDICLRFDIYLKYTRDIWDVPNIYLRNTYDILETYLIYVWNILNWGW